MYLFHYIGVLILMFQCTVSGSTIDAGATNYYFESGTNVNDNITEHWIEQQVDHFNPDDKRTFNMKYYQNIEHWKENGPIYLLLFVPSIQILLPDEPTHPGYERYFSNGLIHQLAKETNGAAYTLIKRYYAHSQKPVNGSDPNYFKYIGSDQSLADAANLIRSLKALPQYEKSKVVVVGGGYGGNLAAWMRMYYPKLVDAALASSARVLAKTDFYEALEKVTDDYRKYGTEGCLDGISGHCNELHDLLKTPEGRERLKKKEDICESSDLSSLDNQGLFFQIIMGLYLVRCRFGDPDFIKQDCKTDAVLKNFKTYPFNELYSESNRCFHIDFKRAMSSLKRHVGYEYELIPTIYQQCNEFGHLITTTSSKQIFYSVTLEYLIHWCSELFGDDFDKERVDRGVENTNKLYGGLNPNVSKVIFTNGEIDPSTELGITEDLSEDALAIVIEGASESRDLLKDHPSDSPSLRAARKRIKDIIKKWIKE